jgi:hypothetical protein
MKAVKVDTKERWEKVEKGERGRKRNIKKNRVKVRNKYT